MALTQQYNVTLIGTEGTGKTCFLAGLALLGFDAISKTPFQVFPPDEEAKKYLNNLRDTLQNGSWMPPTNISTLICFDLVLRRTRTTLRLQMLDYSGESFRTAYNELSAEDAAAFSEHLANSKVVLLLLDAKDLASTHNEEHRHVLSEKIRAQLAAVWEKMGKGTDIGVLITKSDTIPKLKSAAAEKDHGVSTAEQFVKEHLGDFKETLREIAQIEGFKGIKDIDTRKIVFFPVSAVGETDAETGRPAKGVLKPYGYNAVFQWIAERPDRLLIKWVLSVTLIVLICIGVTLGIAGTIYKAKIEAERIREENFQANVENPNLSVFEKLEKANTFRPLTDVMREQRKRVVDAELERQRIRIASAPDNQTLYDIRTELERLKELGVGGAENELRLLIGAVARALVDFYYRRVSDAFQARAPNFLSDAEHFLRNYPDVSEAANVRDMRDRWGQDEMRLARIRISEIAVNSPSQLQNKMERVGSFLRGYESRLTPSEQEEMRNAIALARKFLESTDYTVTLRQYGGFAHSRSARLNITTNNSKRNFHTASGSVQVVNPGTPLNVRWKSGETIELELETYVGPPSGWVRAASIDRAGVDAIALLNGRQQLTPATNTGLWGWDWSIPNRMADGGYFVVSEIQGITQTQWEAYEKWIKPGYGWREAP